MSKIKIFTINANKIDDCFQGQMLTPAVLNEFTKANYQLKLNYQVIDRTNDKAVINDQTGRRKFMLKREDTGIDVYFLKKKLPRRTELNAMSSDEKLFMRSVVLDLKDSGVRAKDMQSFKLKALADYRERKRANLAAIVEKKISDKINSKFGTAPKGKGKSAE